MGSDFCVGSGCEVRSLWTWAHHRPALDESVRRASGLVQLAEPNISKLCFRRNSSRLRAIGDNSRRKAKGEGREAMKPGKGREAIGDRKQGAKEWGLAWFGAGFDEAAEHFGDFDAAFLEGGGGLLVKVYSLRLKTFIFSPPRRKDRKGPMPVFLCVLRVFAVN